jgi:putative PIN family toxin of toxin-antitoxin system
VKRIVLDTSTLVSGLRSRLGASFAILRLIAEGETRPVATTAPFLEYEAVFKRPEHHTAQGLSSHDLDQFLIELAAVTDPVEVHFRWRPQLTDPCDEMVLEAAVNGQADAIVTHNVRDFIPAAGRFGTRVLTPAEFLQGLRS